MTEFNALDRYKDRTHNVKGTLLVCEQTHWEGQEQTVLAEMM